MGKTIRMTIISLAGVAIIGGALYAAGYRIVDSTGQPLFGSTKKEPGWRRAAQEQGPAELAAPGAGQGRQQMGGAGSGSGQGRQQMGGGPGSGAGQGGQQMGGGGSGSGQGQGRLAQGNQPAPGSRGRQPGLGPTGGILLPIKVGATAIPVLVSGKAPASFVGQDLIDHVEDTVVATADGPRKGWAIEKTLKYLGIDHYTGAILQGPNGQKVVVSLQQIQDQQTIPLFTYDETGRLMVVSGPKVRGTNKGNLSLDDVKKTVAGRTDLLNFSGIEKVEVKG